MMKKCKLIYFVGLILFVSIIGVACSKKGAEPADTKAQITNKPTVQGELSPTQCAEVTKAPESEENNSPWKLLSDSTVETSVFYAGFLNESTGVTVGYEGAISYTSDGGKTWTPSDIKSACRYGLSFYDDSFLVTSGNLGVNMTSKDKGKSWTKLGEFPLKGGGEFNKFLSVIDKKNIYIGAPQALGVTKDGGKTWKEIALPKQCKKIMGMFFLTSKDGYILGKDGTLFKTTDSCKTWTTQTIDLKGEKIIQSPMPAVAINFQNENDGMIVFGIQSYQLVCLKTSDGGKTWETVEVPKSYGLSPYLSRDGKFLTLSALTKQISLYKLEDK